MKPNGQARLRYAWDGTIVEVYLAPKGDSKSTIVAVSKELPKAPLVDERRAQWRTVLGALALHLKG